MISNEVMGIIGFLELHIYCAFVLMILLPTTIIYNRKRNKGTNRYVVLVYLFFFVLIVCDKGRVEKALISLGRDELDDMIKKGETIELSCQVCNKKYYFTIEELKSIISKCK